MLAARGCCETLMNVLLNLSSKEEPDDIVCFERAGAALASLMLYHTNQEKLISMILSISIILYLDHHFIRIDI